MPASYAHHRFGKQVLKTMPGDARQCISRFRRMYDMGLHGPDIFFYYNPFWKTAMEELGVTLHLQKGQDFFSVACKAADSEAARAYLYGLLAHYCLDSKCHPLVNQLNAIGEARHAALEAEFDRHLLLMDGEKAPEHFDLSKKLHLTRGECMTVAEFYPGAEGAHISRSVKRMALFLRFFASGNSKKRRRLLDKIKPGLSDNMIPDEDHEDLAFYVGELQALYDQALEAYPLLLQQLTAHMESGEALGADFEPDFG